MSNIRTFSSIGQSDRGLVGGKGLSLGLMAVAGLPVPPGFCVTSTAYQSFNGSLAAELRSQLLAAYADLGRGLVAVRSSATAEDGAEASFAGQQETILGVEGEEALLAAVERCWASLHTERAKAYRQKQGVDEAGLAMAVVVQRLVNAEVAGVLFTRDPMDPANERMLIEASWGLGEAVVSGRVQPDRFQVEHRTGAVLERHAGDKRIRITAAGEAEVSETDRQRLCLDDRQLGELAELGRRVEAFYGECRDVEWAFANGQFFLLQARPITTGSAGDREQVRRAEIARVAALPLAKETVWSRFNLTEVLPEPTPMTWSIIDGWLLSGRGGTGGMYRDFGFKPSPAMENRSAYDLICGRPYCNLLLEPKLQATKPIFGYPLDRYRKEPHLALDPKVDTTRKLGGWKTFMRLPAIYWGLIRSTSKIMRGVKQFPETFRKEILPAFEHDLHDAHREKLAEMKPPELLERLHKWIRRTLVDFARESLKPTLFAGFCMQVLEQQLLKPLGPERTRAAIAELGAGSKPDEEADLGKAIRQLSAGNYHPDQFIDRFGHRGHGEMELANPRWAEEPAAIAKWKKSEPPATVTPPSPKEIWERISAEAKFVGFLSRSLFVRVEQMQTHLGLRETGKHHLLRGYAVIRQTLLELDRRFRLQNGIFFLTLDELSELIAGKDFAATIAERRKTRTLALGLEIPAVLFGDDLEAIGRPQPIPQGATEYQGVPLSAGVVEGPALVLEEPASTDAEGYILVCPTTDPSWVPLFVRAKGLVMESGGVLSHGAIVAREFGLPAVAGLPEIQRRIRSGQILRVDGGRGIVAVISDKA